MKEILLKGAEMKALDEYTINTLGTSSRTLMERAAHALAREIMASGADISRVLAFCGPGNNGGDGYAALRFLAQYAREGGIDAEISAYFIGDDRAMTEECARQRSLASEAGIKELSKPDTKGATLIIDAIFGIGLSRKVSRKFGEIIDIINSSNAFVASADIPSGINADNGEIMGKAVKASLTVSFAAYKPGHFLYPGALHCGRLTKADIGIDVSNYPIKIFTAFSSPIPLPHRLPDSNKGSFGKLLIIGGSENMAGAAYLSALGAYRSGAGLVRIFTTEENRIILQTLLPEAVLTTYRNEESPDQITDKLKKAISDSDAVVIGPGLSQNETAKTITSAALHRANERTVIDADALNIIASEPALWNITPKNAIITPHMGEMSRLTGIDITALKADPIEHCASFASKKDVICAMKDARTAISDGEITYLNSRGSSGLSKGGSGDVLAGIIGSFLACGMSGFDAACLGVYLHSRAGELASEHLSEYSLLARDIAGFIPNAIKEEI